MDTKTRCLSKKQGRYRLTLGMGLLGALLALAPGAWAGTLQVNGSTGVVNVLEGGTANVSWDFSENAPATGVLLRVNNTPMGPCTNPPPYPDFSNPDSGYSVGTIGSKALTLTDPRYVPGNTYAIKVCAWKLGGNPDNLGPESNTVLLHYGEKVVDLVTESEKPKLQLTDAAKGLLKKKPAELEIMSIAGLPAQVCPDRNYNVFVTIVNHGDWQARFHLCSVGSHTYSCDLGQPQIHEIKGNTTKTLPMSLKPASPFIEDGKWHGKVFLGKVASPVTDTKITIQGQGGQPSGSSDCNVGVSTSWTGAPGLSAGTLFCDKNMDNHLVVLEVNSNPILCKGLKKKVIQGTTSTGPGADSGSDSFFGVYMDISKPRRKSAPKVLKRMLPKAKLAVEDIAHWPVRLKAGKAFKLEIKFKNKGQGKSASNAKYKIFCTVLSGGGPNKECPVPNNKTSSLNKSLAPGQTYTVLLLGATKAQAGRYRVSVAVPNQRGRPYSVDLKVAPVRKLKKRPTRPLRSQPSDQRPQMRRKPPSQPKQQEDSSQERPQFRLAPR